MPSPIELKKYSRKAIIAGLATSLTILASNGNSGNENVPPEPMSTIDNPASAEQKTELFIPKTYLTDPFLLVKTKERIENNDEKAMHYYKLLIADAERFLTQKPFSVMDKTQVPPSGDKHDYLSLSTYHHPDFTKPDGLPYIYKDGETNPEINTIPDKNNVTRLINTVHTLSYAFYFSNDSRYGEKAIKFLRTWFIDPATRMNPHLNYAQIVKGIDAGTPAGTIDTYKLPWIIDSLGILEHKKAITPDDKTALQDWFQEFASWLINSNIGIATQDVKNNVGTWHDAQTALYSLYIGDIHGSQAIVEEAKTRRIAQQIDPSGQQPLEMSRSRPFNYSNVNFRALCALAVIGKKIGVDLFEGGSIENAYRFLEPYVTGQQTWDFKEIRPFKIDDYSPPFQRSLDDFESKCYAFSLYEFTGNNAFYNLLYPKPA